MSELEAMIVKCAAIGGMQRSMLTFAMCLFLTRGALCADAPVAKVPHASIPARLDGRVDEAEWRDAAIIRGALSNPGAAVYLKYDRESLWVGVRCFETEAGYPKAYVRQPTDLLENDDSVQVVLGIADNASGDRGAINFGGAERRMGCGVEDPVCIMGRREPGGQDLAGNGPVKIVSFLTDKDKLPAEAGLKVFSKSGKELLSRTLKLPSHETPKWRKTDAGRDYVDARVPKPWTKPAIVGRSVCAELPRPA